MRQSPEAAVDAVLAVGLSIAVTVAISVAPEQGETPMAAYALGPALGALSLLRRRWPLGALLASSVTLFVYNQFDTPGMFAAVPLSVTLATAWASGRRLWALVVAAWFSLTPVLFIAFSDELPVDFSSQLVSGLVSDVALMAAVLLLGEAIRGRRALGREQALLLAEQERSESLLLNVLPASIADRLRDREDVIADGFADVTVMFADLVDFTVRSDGVSPGEVVQELNGLFTVFDELAERHGLEKIKTIGDAYMVAGGIPDPRPDHAEAVALMALAVRDAVSGRHDPGGRPLEVRIGIDTGPVVAGVIGRHKFSYDLWGDTVNTASRMESHGVPGRIQVTERTYRRLKDDFDFEYRGPVEVKGKGEMVTWFLMTGKLMSGPRFLREV